MWMVFDGDGSRCRGNLMARIFDNQDNPWLRWWCEISMARMC